MDLTARLGGLGRPQRRNNYRNGEPRRLPQRPWLRWERRFWRAAVPVALVVLVVLIFMPALDAGLVEWDDDDLLIHNTRYQELSSDALRWMFTTSFSGHFQPLTWLSYTLDWALWQRELFGYHLTNVILHALTTVVFFFIVRRLLFATTTAAAVRSRSVILCSAFSALLFAVHPLRVESVAWLAERRDVLSGFSMSR